MLNAEGNAEVISAFSIREAPPQRAVSRILFSGLAAEVTIIPLAPSSLTGSSGLPGGARPASSYGERAVALAKAVGRAVLVTPPYLALLRAGFCLPPVLPRARCALTAPFHPYPPSPSGLRWASPSTRHRRSACSRSLPTVAPKARRWAVCFLCHYPSGHPDRALPGALPFGVRTFLSPSRPSGASAQRARWISQSTSSDLPRRSVRRTRRRAIVWPAAAAFL